MVFGTQWYLLFNVIAGASTIPTELRYAARQPGPERLAELAPGLPAAGGVPELRHRRHHRQRRLVERQHRGRVRRPGATPRCRPTGLGSYIAHMTAMGDFPRIALGIGVMCVFVMGMNHFVWRQLYRLAEDRMHLADEAPGHDRTPSIELHGVGKSFRSADGTARPVLEDVDFHLDGRRDRGAAGPVRARASPRCCASWPG